MNTYARPEHHIVTVRVDREDTDFPVLESVTCHCSAPPDAPCRTYPNCDCEIFIEDDDNPGHDICGQPFEPGRDCWVKPWFDHPYAEATGYVGGDADDDTDCGLPLVDRHGHIDAISVSEGYLEWCWHGEPSPLTVSLDQGTLPLGGAS